MKEKNDLNIYKQKTPKLLWTFENTTIRFSMVVLLYKVSLPTRNIS